ncbi:hypothetical protein ACFV3R_17430 [Streptomyces sp. NPDC059740]|uniref:hypothetical protein n=1 Tax=Streptomyces sp. NPDC059740 TaxID=3346926 RepID=UPI0036522BD0
MHPNTLDAVVSSVVDKDPVMLVHQVTGGYAKRSGDLQVVPDKVAASADRSHRFRMHLEGNHEGNNLYSFENLLQDGAGNLPADRYMSANPADIANGIIWKPKVAVTEGTDEAKAQVWYVIPQECGGGYALLNYLDPTYLLGMIGKTPHLAACGRPNESVYGVIPLIGVWKIVKPNDQQCIHQHTPDV